MLPKVPEIVTPKIGDRLWITPQYKGQLWDKTSLKWMRIKGQD